MSKSRKPQKPKKNRGNVLKRMKLIQKNHEVLKSITSKLNESNNQS